MHADSPDGVLPVDKPEGPTSHDAVARARRALGTRRIGHTGTLDPFASGLLLLCVGSATRIAEYLGGLPKRYRARVRLGIATDTDDRTGTIVRTSEAWRSLDRTAVEAALHAQLGEIEQRPPAFSAKKIEGERAYRRARRGETVAPRPVRVVIHRIEPVRFELPDVELEVDCSAGTYIRSIARDLGDALGVGAHLAALRRTRIGDFDVEHAVPLDAIADEAARTRAWLSPLRALASFPRIDVDDAAAALIRHGRAIPAPAGPEPPEAPVAVAHRDQLVAIATWRDGLLHPRKVFQS